ncbi:MAG: hypothetical protein AAF611_07650 [Bacteroidota bacterium]
MKRKSLKTLGLNKSKVSSLSAQLLTGGDDTVPTSSLATSGVTGTPTSTQLTDIACSLACTGPISGSPSAHPGGCKDK